MELYSKGELLKELKKEYSCGGECDHCPEVLDAGSCSVLRCIRRIIDNATPVKAFTEEDMAGAYNEGYACGGRESKRPQGDLADEVWKLYEKHQSHLATHVIEFGDELKELLDKYQKGGAE